MEILSQWIKKFVLAIKSLEVFINTNK